MLKPDKTGVSAVDLQSPALVLLVTHMCRAPGVSPVQVFIRTTIARMSSVFCDIPASNIGIVRKASRECNGNVLRVAVRAPPGHVKVRARW